MPLRDSAMWGARGVNSSSHVSAASVVSENDSAASPASTNMFQFLCRVTASLTRFMSNIGLPHRATQGKEINTRAWLSDDFCACSSPYDSTYVVRMAVTCLRLQAMRQQAPAEVHSLAAWFAPGLKISQARTDRAAALACQLPDLARQVVLLCGSRPLPGRKVPRFPASAAASRHERRHTAWRACHMMRKMNDACDVQSVTLASGTE